MEHCYLACMALVTSPFDWHYAVTLTFTFDLFQGQVCCRAGDHNSPNSLLLFKDDWCEFSTRETLVWSTLLPLNAVFICEEVSYARMFDFCTSISRHMYNWNIVDNDYSLPLKTLHVLYESTLTLHFTDVGSPEHRLQGIILDISSNRLFKAVRVCNSVETKNRPFLKIKFANKGINALNLSNILNQKCVQSNIPPYFEYKESLCISYSYTSSVATKIFNYKTSLQQIDFQSLSQNPLPCSCSGSEFLYAPWPGDLNIVQNDKLRDLLRKGPKYREPVLFSSHQNFDIIMDAYEA